MDGSPDSHTIGACLFYDLAHLMRAVFQTKIPGHRAGPEGSYFTVNTEIVNSRTQTQTLAQVSRIENVRWEVLGHPPSMRDRE